MNKALYAVIVLIVAVAAFFIGHQFNGGNDSAPRSAAASVKKDVVPFDYRPPAPKISSIEAETHRENHYEDLSSVDDILELPGDFSQTEALYTLAGRASRSELEQYIREAMLIADRYERRAALGILFLRYVEMDPQAGIDYLLSIDLDIDDSIISTVFNSWAKADLNAAIAMANQFVNVAQRKAAGDGILRSTLQTDPGLLVAVEAQLADRHKLDYYQSEAIGLRANYDPETALQEALKLTGRNGRWDAIRRVGIVWARNDPAAAISFAQTIGDANMRRQFIGSVLDRWFDDDPEAAIQNILAQPVASDRNAYLQGGLNRYARINPENAMAIASQLTGRAKDMATNSVFSGWIDEDPDSALRHFAAMEDSPVKRSVMQQIGRNLAGTDPEAALRWVDTLNSEQRSRVYPDILAHMAQMDPQRALQAALASESPEQRRQVLNRVLNHVAHADPQLAARYVSELPAGREREQMYMTLAVNMATNDPQAAMTWAATLSGEAYENAVRGMAMAVAETDPGLAASMIGQVPEEARGQLIRTISGAIASHDPQSALTWLSRFSNDPAYESAVAVVAMNLSREDPRYALRVAEGLSAEHRMQAEQNIVSNWAMTDPVAASRWAANSDAGQRPQVIANVAQVWASMDSVSASRWVRSLRSGEAKDNALVALMDSAGLGAREISDLIGAIGSDTQRDQAILRAYMRLRHQDGEDAAEDMLDSVDASDAVRQQLSQFPGG